MDEGLICYSYCSEANIVKDLFQEKLKSSFLVSDF